MWPVTHTVAEPAAVARPDVGGPRAPGGAAATTRTASSSTSSASAPSAERRRARRRRGLREGLLFAALVAPNLAAILVFSYWPTVYNVVLSLMDWDFISPSPVFVGLQNYVDLFRDPEFGTVLANTGIFTAVTVGGTLVGGLGIGYLLSRKLRFAGLTRTMTFAPHMLPGAAVGIVWLFMFDPTYGLSRLAFNTFGADSPQWTTTSDWSLWAITVAYAWQRLGFVAIIYYTAILDLPKDLFEAASLDGAHGWKLFRSMTLPLLSPVTYFLLLTGIITSAQAFDIIAILTSGGPGVSSTTLTWMVYDQAFLRFDIGSSAAAATVLFVILMVVTVLQTRFAERKVHYS
jgi:sn-glycerol 3-phosphate transport system permease protein